MTTPSIEEFRQNPQLRQEIARAAHHQRDAEIWRLVGRVFTALKAHPKLRESRWLAAHHGW